MRKIALGFIALSSSLFATVASAEPMFPTPPSSQSLVQKADYYHHWHRGWRGPGWRGPGWGYGYRGCFGVRHLCADRWGWGGPGFRRCLWRHGC
ncbi:hypothetical protein [Hyphomicrobium sp. 99]|uniref:hypothetical protein n=1 Tax=Hyphomicrobium sp. 99 TaxID=1163419 RepID=UPI0012E018B7|nr:hypothetical protein [Hyphomicrobium sp. 99]